ncbi:hypothetical protein H4582DRAFT_1925823 [Lactarius indigo]|nr:hypothetical protein H4582DRAFT_1925823 [Lactarius indigo]
MTSKLLLPAGFKLAVLAAVVPSISGYSTFPNFIGCVKNDFSKSPTFKDPAGMTVYGCAFFFLDRGYFYAGVENGEDCYYVGANDYPGGYGSSDKCNIKCPGDSNIRKRIAHRMRNGRPRSNTS